MHGARGVFEISLFLLMCGLLVAAALAEMTENVSDPVITPSSLSTGTPQATGDLFFHSAPLSPEFIAYQARMSQAPGEMLETSSIVSSRSPVIALNDGTTRPFVSGEIPTPIDRRRAGIHSTVPESSGVLSRSASDGIPIPTRFDLRSSNRVSPVRNQGGAETCWAFASMASLESTLLPAQIWDFSENHLKDVMATTQPFGYDRACTGGGNDLIAAAYMTRWSGPVTEASDPYSDVSCSPAPPSLHPAKHVQDVHLLPGRTSSTDNAAIKTALMNQGAVKASFFWSDANYNISTHAYYNASSVAGETNHAIAIVGWDDTYSAANFTSTPPVNGAFIIKNSWGTSFGDNGYFYMSYAEAPIGEYCTVFTGSPSAVYDHEYSYDPLGWTDDEGYGTTTAQFANVFTALSNESVDAIGLWETAPGTFTAQIYLDPSGGPINTSGYVSQASWTDTTFGYRTIPVPPVILKPGQKFSVVLLASTPTYTAPIPAERPFASYSSKATAAAGQSYVSSNGASWTDLTTIYANTNVNVKAFTRYQKQVGIFRPSTHTFYLRNPGSSTSAVNWGVSTDIPVTGDWNGDTASEVGLFRSSTHAFYLKNGSLTTSINWGVSTDIPVTGDWNGDGITEVGVFRPSTHMFYLNTPGSPTTSINWGVSTDTPVTGDWNGDGITEVGVFRSSTHMFYLNIPGSPTTSINWGVSTDTPVTGDVNGDGVTEVGVFRLSTHMFYFRIPGSPTLSINWGVSSDKPVTGMWLLPA